MECPGRPRREQSARKVDPIRAGRARRGPGSSPGKTSFPRTHHRQRRLGSSASVLLLVNGRPFDPRSLAGTAVGVVEARKLPTTTRRSTLKRAGVTAANLCPIDGQSQQRHRRQHPKHQTPNPPTVGSQTAEGRSASVHLSLIARNRGVVAEIGYQGRGGSSSTKAPMY